MFHPITFSSWHNGQLMAFSGLDGPTDFERGIVMRTLFGQAGLDIRRPGNGAIRFGWEPTDIQFSGDYLICCHGDNLLKGAFVDAHHFLIVGSVKDVVLDEALTHARGGQRLLIGSHGHFDATLLDSDIDGVIEQRSSWLTASLAQEDQPSTTYARALSLMKTQVYTPEGQIGHRWTTPDRWPHAGMWLWDSAFHAIGWRHLDAELSRDMLNAVVDCQETSGFIPHFMTPTFQSDITQPPILALAAKLVNDVSPDREWIRTIYGKLSAYVRWDIANRDTDGDGLAEWVIEESDTCRSGESGMDNCSRFDCARQLGAVDFNSFLALECEVLAEFARELNLDDEAKGWESERGRLVALMNETLYSDEHGFYMDGVNGGKSHSTVVAGAGLLPLLCEAAKGDRLVSLLSHMDNPQTLGTPVGVPSVSASDGSYSTDMWRGPMWVSLNWLVAFGLEKSGQVERAMALRECTVSEIEKWFTQYGVFFEYYDSQGHTPPPQMMRKGKCPALDDPNPFPHQDIHDFGWTATLYVDMVKQLSGVTA